MVSLDIHHRPVSEVALYLAGKTFNWARAADLQGSIECVKYYAGWADKITGQLIEVCPSRPSFPCIAI